MPKGIFELVRKRALRPAPRPTSFARPKEVGKKRAFVLRTAFLSRRWVLPFERGSVLICRAPWRPPWCGTISNREPSSWPPPLCRRVVVFKMLKPAAAHGAMGDLDALARAVRLAYLFTGTLRHINFDGKKRCLRLDFGVEIVRKGRENEMLLRSDPQGHRGKSPVPGICPRIGMRTLAITLPSLMLGKRQYRFR